MQGILWKGEHNGVQTRIVSIGDDDALVEQLKQVNDSTSEWVASDDDAVCSNVYLFAYLESRRALAGLYERDMGNLRLHEGTIVLEDAAKILGRDD